MDVKFLMLCGNDIIVDVTTDNSTVVMTTALGAFIPMNSRIKA